MVCRICPACGRDWYSSSGGKWVCQDCKATMTEVDEVPIKGGKQIETRTMSNY